MKPVVLNILIAISAVAAIIFDHLENWNWFAIFKPLTTILIIGIPLFFGKRKPKRYYWSIVIGLIFCLIGDTLLLESDNFIYGLLSFLVGHLLYVIGFISIAGFTTYKWPLIILLGISGLYMSILAGGLGEMLFPVIVYMLVIVLMSWQGIGLYLARKENAFLLVAIGVVAFMLSDSILAYNKFYSAFSFSGVLVLSTYWLAVALIANSTIHIISEEFN